MKTTKLSPTCCRYSEAGRISPPSTKEEDDPEDGEQEDRTIHSHHCLLGVCHYPSVIAGLKLNEIGFLSLTHSISSSAVGFRAWRNACPTTELRRAWNFTFTFRYGWLYKTAGRCFYLLFFIACSLNCKNPENFDARGVCKEKERAGADGATSPPKVD